MSKKFYAVHRQTGQRWKPNPKYTQNYLIMFDSGALAEVIVNKYRGTSIIPLSSDYLRVMQGSLDSQHPPVADKGGSIPEYVPCPRCEGSGKVPDIHGGSLDGYNTCAYDTECPVCDGNGKVLKK